MREKYPHAHTWRTALLPASLILSLVLALFYYWFTAANRHVIFLYEHNGAGAFDPTTVSRYWVAGLVASGLVMVLHVLWQLAAHVGRSRYAPWRLVRRLASRVAPKWFAAPAENQASAAASQTASGLHIWLICAPNLALGISIIVGFLGQPALPPAYTLACVVATVLGLAVALVPGTIVARRPQEAVWLALYGLGLLPALLILRVVELGQNALAAGSVAAGLVYLAVLTGVRLKLRVPGLSALKIWVFGLALSYLLLPLLHHLFFTPPTLRYISVSANFFATAWSLQAICFGVAALLAGSVSLWQSAVGQRFSLSLSQRLAQAGGFLRAKATQLDLGFVVLALAVLAVLYSSNSALASASQLWYALDFYPDHGHPSGQTKLYMPLVAKNAPASAGAIQVEPACAEGGVTLVECNPPQP